MCRHYGRKKQRVPEAVGIPPATLEKARSAMMVRPTATAPLVCYRNLACLRRSQNVLQHSAQPPQQYCRKLSGSFSGSVRFRVRYRFQSGGRVRGKGRNQVRGRVSIRFFCVQEIVMTRYGCTRLAPVYVLLTTRYSGCLLPTPRAILFLHKRSAATTAFLGICSIPEQSPRRVRIVVRVKPLRSKPTERDWQVRSLTCWRAAFFHNSLVASSASHLSISSTPPPGSESFSMVYENTPPDGDVKRYVVRRAPSLSITC